MSKTLLMLPLRSKNTANVFFGPDLGLGYLAAALKKHFGETIKVDLLLNDLDLTDKEFSNYLISGAYDVIGIKVFATSVSDCQRTIALIRFALPEAVLIVGGPQATGDSENILQYIEADFAVAGEGEIGLCSLLEELGRQAKDMISEAKLKQIPGLIWRNKEGNISANQRKAVDDLDSLGAPAWELMPPASFTRQRDLAFSEKFPIAPIITSRGCPFRCTFCSVACTGLRQRSVANVIAELELLYHQYGVREFHVLDDCCGYNKEFLRRFCQALINSRMDLTWKLSIGMRASSFNEDIMQWLKQSRCQHIWIGVESGSSNILKKIQKDTSLEQIRSAVALANRANIGITGFFMIGIPGETKKDIQQTLDFAMGLGLQGAVFNIFTPVPGTALYKELWEQGRIHQSEFDSMDQKFYRNTFTELSPDELIRLRALAYWRFHLRPRIILSRLRFFVTLIVSPSRLCLWLRYIYWNLHSKRKAW